MLSLSPDIEQHFQESLQSTEHGTYLTMDPGLAQRIVQNINRSYEESILAEGQPVLLTTPAIRPHLAQLLARFIPTLPVISQAEIPPDINLNSIGMVTLNAS